MGAGSSSYLIIMVQPRRRKKRLMGNKLINHLFIYLCIHQAQSPDTDIWVICTRNHVSVRILAGRDLKN